MDIAALIAFFMTVSFWVWALIAVLNIGILRWVEKASAGDDESPLLATICVIAALVALQLCGIPVWQYVAAHPVNIAYGLLAYLATGTAWSIVRWYLYTKDQFHRYEEFKIKFLRSHNIFIDVIPDALKDEFAEAFRWRIGGFVFHPQVTENKSRIYMWMAYWPWSMLWTVLNRPIKAAFNFIYSEIRSLLQKISDHAWAGAENDLPKKKQK
jgi:hypothetical protein